MSLTTYSKDETREGEPLLDGEKEQERLIQPHLVAAKQFGHRRHNSTDTKMELLVIDQSIRKCSLPPMSLSDRAEVMDNLQEKIQHSLNVMSSETRKKSLSERKDVDLHIKVPERPSMLSQASTEMNAAERTPALTESPIGHTTHNINPPMDHRQKNDILSIRVYVSRVIKNDAEPEKDDEDAKPGVQFEIVGGRRARAELLMSLMAKQYDMDLPLAVEAFSLWLVSPLLEVQLKPHHVPFEIVRGWPTLLARFAHGASEDDIVNDLPCLYFRRNVQLSNEKENEIITFCDNSLKLLWDDCRVALFSDRLAMQPEKAAVVAGIGFAIEYGAFCEGKHTVQFIRKNLETQLPDHIADTIRGSMVFGKAISGPKELENLIIKTWKKVSEMKENSAMKDIDDMRKNEPFMNELRRKYIHAVQDGSPCYGSAFFDGVIERPSLSPLKDIKRFFQSVTMGVSADVEVQIGINREFITVVEKETKELLLVQKISDCSWRKIEKTPEEKEKGIDSRLLLHFPSDEDSDDSQKGKSDERRNSLKKKKRNPSNGGSTMSCKTRTNLLQVFGCQTVLMDTLLTAMHTCQQISMQQKKDLSPVGYSSESGYSSGEGGSPLGHAVVSRASSFSKHNKMCLASFEGGQLVKASGSLKKVNWNNMKRDSD